MNLINLWSADPLPTQVPQTFVFFVGPVQTVRSSGPVWRSSSSDFSVRFPGPISSAGFSQSRGFTGVTGVIQLLGSASVASSMRLISLASGFPSTSSVLCRVPRLNFGPLGPCLHQGPSALALCWAPSYIRTILGRSSLSFHHGLPGLRLCLDPPPLRLHRAHPSLWFPSRPRSLHRSAPVSQIPGSASVTRANRFTLGF